MYILGGACFLRFGFTRLKVFINPDCFIPTGCSDQSSGYPRVNPRKGEGARADEIQKNQRVFFSRYFAVNNGHPPGLRRQLRSALRSACVKRSTGRARAHTHTPTENNTPDTRTHDNNNTPNPQTNTPHLLSCMKWGMFKTKSQLHRASECVQI